MFFFFFFSFLLLLFFFFFFFFFFFEFTIILKQEDKVNTGIFAFFKPLKLGRYFEFVSELVRSGLEIKIHNSFGIFDL